MGTLMLGMLIVVASAAGFGLALFGRRPVPQPAMPGNHAERASSPAGDALTGSTPAAGPADGRLGSLRTSMEALRARRHKAADEVAPSTWTRVRAALLLGLTVVGLAALIGGTLSIILVGLVLLAT